MGKTQKEEFDLAMENLFGGLNNMMNVIDMLEKRINILSATISIQTEGIRILNLRLQRLERLYGNNTVEVVEKTKMFRRSIY